MTENTLPAGHTPKPETRKVHPGIAARTEFLEQVKQCVCSERNVSYGDASDNFARIAQVANVLLEGKLKEPLDSMDVAKFSIALKIGRMAHSPEEEDHWLDLAGYAACGAGIMKTA